MKQSAGRGRRLYYAADLHGADLIFRKFISAATFYDADTLIIGGDLTGKAMVPVVESPDGTVRTLVAGRVQSADREHAADLENRIRMNGFYPFRCDHETYDRLVEDVAYREAVFTDAMKEGLRHWVRLADEKLDGSGVRIFTIPGNDDGWFFEEVIGESSVMVNHDGCVVDLGENQLLGLGWSNVTPWHTYRELSEADLAARLERLRAQIDPAKPLVANIHVPPYGSGLDMAPAIREDLSIVVRAGEATMTPVGSTAVRDFLLAEQPFLSLHGHIHESRGAVKLGRTLAINPGSEYSNGVLRGALVTIEKGEVKAYHLVSG